MPESKQGKLTQEEYTALSRDMELDLIAAFSLMYEDVLKILGRAQDEEWSPDILIQKIGEII